MNHESLLRFSFIFNLFRTFDYCITSQLIIKKDSNDQTVVFIRPLRNTSLCLNQTRYSVRTATIITISNTKLKKQIMNHKLFLRSSMQIKNENEMHKKTKQTHASKTRKCLKFNKLMKSRHIDMKCIRFSFEFGRFFFMFFYVIVISI